MKTDHPPRPGASALQKTFLVLLGLLLALVLLEGGLRLGGFILLSLQDLGNQRSIQQKGTYRILCLGESTTQGQYPSFLEKALNERNIGVRFSVIDKGLAGALTPDILSRVESFLDEYKPDMVVAMMGINDWGVHMPREMPTASEAMLFIRSLRTYKLARLLWLHLSVREAAGRSRKISGGPFSAEDLCEKVIETDPRNHDAYTELGRVYVDQGRFSDAEDSYRKAIEIEPRNGQAYTGLGRVYLDQGKISEAEHAFKEAIAIDPKNNNAHLALGRLFQYEGRFSEAEDSFKKVIELDPKDHNAHAKLGRIYQDQGRFSEAEGSLKKAIELNPKNDRAYAELGVLYQEQGKLKEAEGLLRKGIEMNSGNDRLSVALSSFYEETGNPRLEEAYAKESDRLGAYYHSVTQHHYRELQRILSEKGIKLVCVQYPMRSVGALKKLFAREDGMIFVDNEKVFKEAVRQGSYKEYFVDTFAGDFGHCTQKGNRLLAANIAESILREMHSASNGMNNDLLGR